MKTLLRPISLLLVLAMSLHGPATVALASPSPAPAPKDEPPPPTPEDYLAMYQGIFEQLFGLPFQAEHWTYPLASAVTEPGTYGGANQYGQSFTLEALATAEVDLTTLDDLTPEQIQEIEDRQLTYVGVLGTLDTSLASIPVAGAVISGTVNGQMDHRFFISDEQDETDELYSPTALLDVTPDPLPTPETEPEPVDDDPVIDPAYAYLLKGLNPPPGQAKTIETVFQTLFGHDPAEDDYLLHFDDHISGPGTYAGSLGDGIAATESFAFMVVQSEPLDVTALQCYEPELTGHAVEAGYNFHHVTGTLSTESGSASVSGVTIALGQEPSSLSISEELPDPWSTPTAVCAFDIPLPVLVPYACRDQACLDACQAVYDAEAAAALAARDAAGAAATATLNSQVAQADANFAASIAAAGAILSAALAACARSQAQALTACALIGVLGWWTGFGAFALCLARVAAIYAACIAAAHAAYNFAYDFARSLRDGTVANARNQYEAAIAAIEEAFSAALEAAAAALAACRDGCWMVCWFIIWVWVPL